MPEPARRRPAARSTGATASVGGGAATGGASPHAARRRASAAPDPARDVALAVLRAVAERDAYANLVLPGLASERRLSPRDAAFATELCYGTLRMRGQLDAVLAACVDRPLSDVDAPLLAALRLGAYQLLHTRVPPHAAVSASVSLVRRAVGEGPSRFANAILRRVTRHDLAGWLTAVAPAYDEDPVAHLAVVTSHPAWVVSAFADALGGDPAQARAALDADNTRPIVHLAARPGRLTRAALLAAAGAGAEAGPWSPYSVRIPGGGDPASLPQVRDGSAGVQDEGSQLAALALVRAPLEGSDARWLDMAAGPGGKAALLAGLAGERGASLLAGELAPHRARLVRRSLGGVQGVGTLTVVADGRSPAWAPAGFDRVLLDAPCSGLGALRRRPEARWRRHPEDLPQLGRLQRDLLTRAVESVRPGGVVAYVTCSPHVAETRAVVSDLLRADPTVEQLDARPAFDGVPSLGAGPSVQLWPHLHGTDAMYVALLRKHPG